MYDWEELIAAEIDLEKIIAAKATHDTTGRYTRPDLLHFEIREAGEVRGWGRG